MSLSRKFRSLSCPRGGFRFIEIMLVVVIIGVLAGLVFPSIVRRVPKAKIEATRAQMSQIKTALLMFQADIGRLPTTEEGLQALVSCPHDLDASTWEQQMEEMPRDAWGKPFEYLCPSAHDRSFDLTSAGPDRKFQTEDDVHNWDGRSEESKS